MSRDGVAWVGDIGRQATHLFVRQAAAGDPVWAAGLTEKADRLLRGLLGENPSVLDGFSSGGW